MAPRGLRNQASAGRETRSTALNTKASTRGGVSKKRGGPNRTDKDGDLDMDSPARKATRTTATPADNTNRRGSTRSVPNGRGASKMAQTVLKHLNRGDPTTLGSRISGSGSDRRAGGRAHADGLTYLRVHGLKKSKAASNADGGLQSLVSFLERKASAFTGTGRSHRSIIINKSHVVGDHVFVATKKEDAEHILKVNSFAFAGAPLEITESADGLEEHSKATESDETTALRGTMRTILSSRYVGGNKLLKLDSLAADPQLVNLGAFEHKERAVKMLKALMVVCDAQFRTGREKSEAIESISLAGNNIDDVAQVDTVATTFPHLKNLDLSNNQIGSVKGLERWKGKLRDMETLYLTGNPIEAADSSFHTTLLGWFARLQNINGTVVRTPEQVAAALQAASKHHPIPQRGPDFRDVNGIGENFLLEFFTSYDNDRQGLASKLYDEKSQFSLAVDSNAVKSSDTPNARWGPYIKASRNLIKITTPNARIQRLFKGGNVISELWKSLPATRHPNIKDDISKYIMDCHPLSGLADPTNQAAVGVDGLIISVHGEFDEHDVKTDTLAKRSFSRTIVLGPGLPGRAHIRVVSDMLSLRAFNPLPNVFEASKQQPQSGPLNDQAMTSVQKSNDPDQRRAMIAELCKQTGMTPQYSEMCLSQVDWVFDKALVIFNEKKGQLPAEAFANGL